jgi:hypothetical protein
MKVVIFGVILLVTGFAMGQMSAQLVSVNPWVLSLFVAGLGLSLGYVSRQTQNS